MHSRFTVLPCLFALLACLACPLAANASLSWYCYGPAVDSADIDGPTYPVGMKTNLVDGYAHVAYFRNANHAIIQNRVLELAYAYEDATGTHELTFYTLPQEIDDGDPRPYTHMWFTPCGVSLDMRQNPTTGNTEVAVCYYFRRHYDHDPTAAAGDEIATELLYLYYQHLEVSGGVVTPVGGLQNVFNADGTSLGVSAALAPDDGLDSGYYGFASGATHVSGVSVALDDSLRPYIVFAADQLMQLGPPIEVVHRLQVPYRYVNALGQWTGSDWTGFVNGFTGTILEKTDPFRSRSGVSVAMDRSVIPNVACAAFSTIASATKIYCSEFPFSTYEVVTSGLPFRTNDHIHGRGVSLIAPDSSGALILAYDGSGVTYKEKPSGGAWSAPVVVSSADDYLGSLAVTPGGARVWASYFDMASGEIFGKWKDLSGATWSNEVDVHGANLLWTPVCDAVAWYNKPVVAGGEVTDLGCSVNGGMALKLCSAIVVLEDEKDDTSISDGTVSMTDGSNTWTHDSQIGGVYRFHEVFRLLSGGSFQCTITATAPGYDAATAYVTINRGLCSPTVTIQMDRSDGCGAAPIDAETGAVRSLVPLVPLGIALAAILGWTLLRKREARA